MAWNIHVLCNLLCATYGIVMHGIVTLWNMHIMATHAIAMNGTHVSTNMQITFVIYQQLTYKNKSNSVHNCEATHVMHS